MEEVILEPQEIRLAADIGVTRRIASLLARMKSRAGYPGHNDWQVDIVGALGELAFAKALGVYWEPGVNSFKLADVGSIHVRATTHPGGALLVRRSDPQGIYALVVVALPACRIVGWGRSPALCRDEYLRRPDPARPPCWAIPHEALSPLSELRAIIAGKENEHGLRARAGGLPGGAWGPVPGLRPPERSRELAAPGAPGE